MSDPRRLTERDLQIYVADLLHYCGRRDVLFLHPANEGKRSKREGASLKRQGMIPGASDFIVIVRGQAHALELKTRTGRHSAEQKAFADAAAAAEVPYATARSPEEAKAVLASWGALRPDSVADVVKHMLSA